MFNDDAELFHDGLDPFNEDGNHSQPSAKIRSLSGRQRRIIPKNLEDFEAIPDNRSIDGLKPENYTAQADQQFIDIMGLFDAQH